MRGVRGIGLLAVAVVLLGASVAAANFREKIEELAAELVKGLPAGRSLRLAVADLPDLRGTTSDFGRFTAERLATRLAQAGRFTVIERRRLSQVLGELKFSMSDLVDPAKARRLGQMLGVEALVVGSISDLGNQVDVDLRVIEIETNRMMLGTSTTITKDQVVAELMKAGHGEAAMLSSAPTGPVVGASAPGPPRTAKRLMRMPNATLEIIDVRRSGSQITLIVMVTNQAEKQSEFCISYLSPNNTYFVDGLGNRLTKGKVSPDRCFNAEPNVPERVVYTFEDVASDATNGTLSIYNDTGGAASPRARATERNIPLPR
jgi:TolB-like protein